MAGLVTLAACPPGLFRFNGSLGFKSEYGAMELVTPPNVPGDRMRWIVGAKPDAYCADSGEYFWGGAKTKDARNDLLVEPIDGQALLDERDYWRQSVACYIASARLDLKRKQQGEPFSQSPKARLREHVTTLQSAMDGDYFQPCEACGEPVRPGQPVVSSSEAGEFHAQPCMGATDEQVAAGRMPADPEAVERQDEEDPEEAAAIAADPHFTIHPSEPVYTDEQIAAELTRGAAILAQIRNCVPVKKLRLAPEADQ